MPPRKKTRRRKSARSDGIQRLKIAFSVLFLFGFLFLSLILLSEWRASYRTPYSSPPAEQSREVPTFEELHSRLEAVLRSIGVPHRSPASEATTEPFVFEMEEEYPGPEALALLRRQLHAISPRFGIDSRSGDGELAVLWEGRPRYLLRFRPEMPQVVPETPEVRIAIIMDDLGRDLETMRELLRVELPVTVAVLPNTPQAEGVATLAHQGGREVMIHIPMEPLNYPERNPGYDALFVGLEPEEVRRRMAAYFERIPYASGGNNHMGSRFTQSKGDMAPVLSLLQEKDLFFVDSLTSAHSVAFNEARRMGIPAAARDIFLDNERDVEEISRQIRILAQLAVRRGEAVGICHPYPETLEALRRAIPYLKEARVKVVPVSHLLVR